MTSPYLFIGFSFSGYNPAPIVAVAPHCRSDAITTRLAVKLR